MTGLKNPFNSDKAFSTIVKNMEMRWGLSLVSFLPTNTQQNIIAIQKIIALKWNNCPNDNFHQGHYYFNFYDPSHLHCTHLTLIRSDPCGPIKVSNFVKPDQPIFNLFKIINEITPNIKPFTGILDRITISPNGLELILLGKCADQQSRQQRIKLFEYLNEQLLQSFHISRRKWDNDASKYHEIHCCIGYLKRPVPVNYHTFVDEVKSIDFEPISFEMKDITLVHHRYRSLAFPQEGEFIFPLGKDLKITESEFVQKLNLK